jgi:hypothetical protein
MTRDTFAVNVSLLLATLHSPAPFQTACDGTQSRGTETKLCHDHATSRAAGLRGRSNILIGVTTDRSQGRKIGQTHFRTSLGKGIGCRININCDAALKMGTGTVTGNGFMTASALVVAEAGVVESCRAGEGYATSRENRQVPHDLGGPKGE